MFCYVSNKPPSYTCLHMLGRGVDYYYNLALFKIRRMVPGQLPRSLAEVYQPNLSGNIHLVRVGLMIFITSINY